MRARTDMCMAALCGGLAFLKGLGLGHALTHAIGAHYHLPHGRAAIFGLLGFVMANKETCRDAFMDMAYLINRTDNLEGALRWLYRELQIDLRLKSYGISREALPEIAFYTSRDAVNMATDPTAPSQSRILELLTTMYE
jgi:alcohol dehydrogenase class IV